MDDLGIRPMAFPDFACLFVHFAIRWPTLLNHILLFSSMPASTWHAALLTGVFTPHLLIMTA